MQKLVAFILLITFTAQTFNQGLYYLDYAIDRASYEKNCVNKARPMLQCKGKCQLMKKIREQEEKEKKQAPELKLASKSETISSRSFFAEYNPVWLVLTRYTYATGDAGLPIDQPSAFFHPPNS